GEDGDANRRRQLLLILHKEPAAGRDRADALALEGARALDERGQKSLGAPPDDEVGVGAAHPVVAHGERERGGVAHVAGDARKARVEYEDADGEAVLVEPAPPAPGTTRPYPPLSPPGRTDQLA